MLKKYFKILVFFGKISLMNQTAYRYSFFLAILGKVMRIGILLIFFQVIYFNTALLGNWDFQQALLLSAVYLTVEFLAMATFHRNLAYYLPDLIKKGDFDFILIKPINKLFYSSFRVIDFFDFISFIPVLFLWYFLFTNYSYNFNSFSLILFLLLLLNALFFVFSLSVLIFSLLFRVITSVGLGRFLEGIYRVARIPTDIYGKVFKLFLSYVFPLAFIAVMPVKVFLGLISWPFILYSFVFTFLLFLITLKVWNYALNHYSSASS